MTNLSGDIGLYKNFANDTRSQVWVVTLEQAHTDIVTTGNQLITLKDSQTENLQVLLTAHGELSNLLLGTVRPSRPEDFVYQTIVDGMQEAAQEMLTAVTSYLASPLETNRIQFTEAAVSFRENYALLNTIAAGPEETTWNTQIDLTFQSLEQLGSQLISERDNQQSLFANFFHSFSTRGNKPSSPKFSLMRQNN